MADYMYILGNDGRTPIPCDDGLIWAEWIRVANDNGSRRVAYDEIVTSSGGRVEIATVFLGVRQALQVTPPLLFETTITGGPMNGNRHQYASWEEAEEAHERAVLLMDLVMAMYGLKDGTMTQADVTRKLEDGQLPPKPVTASYDVLGIHRVPLPGQSRHLEAPLLPQLVRVSDEAGKPVPMQLGMRTATAELVAPKRPTEMPMEEVRAMGVLIPVEEYMRLALGMAMVTRLVKNLGAHALLDAIGAEKPTQLGNLMYVAEYPQRVSNEMLEGIGELLYGEEAADRLRNAIADLVGENEEEGDG